MRQHTNMSGSLLARLGRGALVTGGSFVLSQALRFGSNLILARLLFPEAFGLMALVAMILFALTMLSDAGVQHSIMQHPRGDDPGFLNTAFTINAIRGTVLFAVAAALAWPLAILYGAPELRAALPVAAISLFLAGLSPTGLYTRQRHIQLGRIMVIQLAAQVSGIALMILLAWLMESYWALIWGVVLTAVMKLILEWSFLPGAVNRLHWNKTDAGQLLRFGAWVLLSSTFGFLMIQGDRAILGYFMTLSELGIYNIAWFLAAFPSLLLAALNDKMIIPAYRESLEADDIQTRARLKRIRAVLTGGIMTMIAILALTGPWLIGVLYDDRYASAGPIMVLIACAQLVPLVSESYGPAALARGDSRGFFRISAYRACAQTSFFLLGFVLLGLPGALAGQALGILATYPIAVQLARRHQVWDGRHDLFYYCAAAGVIALALTVHQDQITLLMP